MLLALILKALLDDFCFSLQRGGNSIKQRRRKKTSIFSTFAYRTRGVTKKREQWLHKDTHEHQTALVSAIFYHFLHHFSSCFFNKLSAIAHSNLDFTVVCVWRSFFMPSLMILLLARAWWPKSRKQRRHKKASIFCIFASRSSVVAKSRTQRPHKETHATTPKQDDPQIQIIWPLGSPGGQQNASKNNNAIMIRITKMDVHMFYKSSTFGNTVFWNLRLLDQGTCPSFTNPRLWVTPSFWKIATDPVLWGTPPWRHILTDLRKEMLRRCFAKRVQYSPAAMATIDRPPSKCKVRRPPCRIMK